MDSYPAPPTNQDRRDEGPTASAHLTISLTKIDSSMTVPATEGRYVMRLVASLIGLAVMTVICPTVTLREGRHVLPGRWIACLVIFELITGFVLAVLPYKDPRPVGGHLGGNR